MSYTLPQTQVFQEFKRMPVAVTSNLNAFIFGPNYKLFRYAEADEKHLTGLGSYNPSASHDYSYPMQPYGSTVDQGYIKLFIENLLAEYRVIPVDLANPLVCVSPVERNKLRAAPVVSSNQVAYKGQKTKGVAFLGNAGGFYTGGIELPEDYYFYPQTSGSLDGDDVNLAYATTEGASGVIVLRGADRPLREGKYTELADGIVAKLTDTVAYGRKCVAINFIGAASDAGDKITIDGEEVSFEAEAEGEALATGIKDAYETAVGAESDTAAYIEQKGAILYVYKDAADLVVNAAPWALNAPSVSAVASFGMVRTGAVKFIGEDSAVLKFTIKPGAIKTLANLDIDDSKSFSITVEKALSEGELSAVYDTATHNLTIKCRDGVDSLADIRATVLGTPEGAWLDATVLSADAGDQKVKYLGDASGSLGDGYKQYMLRDVYRVQVTPNEYVFATGNGIENSNHFKSRGVRIGDRVRYSVTQDGTEHVGTTYVTGFEADKTAAVFSAPTSAISNTKDQSGLAMTPGVVLDNGIVVARPTNRRKFNGEGTGLFALSTTAPKYTGDYAKGVISDTFTIRITKAGDAGTACATVTSVNGYYREDVPIWDDGSIYIGYNLKMVLVKGDTDANGTFQAGDVYTLSTPVTAPFVSQTPDTLNVIGQYTGPRDTRYSLEVVRGGVFTRTTNVTQGGYSPRETAIVTADNASMADIDDEYVLTCTKGGEGTAAEFELTSQLGDNTQGIVFQEDGGAYIATSKKGLKITWVKAELAPTPTFAVGNCWVIRVFGVRPLVRVADTAGVDQTSFSEVTPGVPIALGSYGGSVIFDTNLNLHGGLAKDSGGGLMKGDVFYVDAQAAGNGPLKTLVLADDLPAGVICGREVGDLTDRDITNDWKPNYNPTLFGINLYLRQLSTEISNKRVQSAPEFNWEASEDAVTINSGLAVRDASWVNANGTQDYLPVYTGDMFLEYRALLSDYADGIYGITSIGDIVETLGVVDVDNPLAQGVYNAMVNSGDRTVYFMGVPSDDLAGYLSVLNSASLVNSIYGLVPLSTDTAIKAAVEAHINELSGSETKRWRIGFLADTLPTEVGTYTEATSVDGQTNWTATITANPSSSVTQNTLLTVTNGAPKLTTDGHAGDTVRIGYESDPWGDVEYTTYKVARVLSNNTLLLKTGPVDAVSAASKVEIWHTNSKAEMAATLKAQGEYYANRRIVSVFPDALFLDGKRQGGVFGAAAIAGLCSSVVPQQGLTNIELNGFDDVPSVYRMFNHTELNTIASGGNLIIMQEQAGGRIYVRHQLTTAAVHGNLLTTELSITKNLDACSYYMATILDQLSGRYNVTPELLTVISTQMRGALSYLGGGLVAAGLLGPMLILDNGNTKVRSIEQHPILADHIVIVIDLEMPVPANVIQLRLVAGANTGMTTAVN